MATIAGFSYPATATLRGSARIVNHQKRRSCLARIDPGALVSMVVIATVPGGEARGAHRPLFFPLTFPVNRMMKHALSAQEPST
jgi:hypothetical protein